MRSLTASLSLTPLCPAWDAMPGLPPAAPGSFVQAQLDMMGSPCAHLCPSAAGQDTTLTLMHCVMLAQAARQARNLTHPLLCLDAIQYGVEHGGYAGLEKVRMH